MATDDRIRKSRKFRNPLIILGFVMTAFYITLGVLLLFSKGFLPDIQTDFRNIFAVLVLVYGIYRGWRVYADYYQNK